MSRFKIYLKSHWYKLQLFLFPAARQYESLRLHSDSQTSTIRRLEAEAAILKDRLKSLDSNLAQATLASRNALDKATSATIANQQLSEQLQLMTKELADRLERAYGSLFNWTALGGFNSKRTPFPHLPVGELPVAQKPLDVDLNRPRARDVATSLAQETLLKMGLGTKHSSPQPPADWDAIQARIDKGELMVDAAGNLREVAKTQ